MTIEEMKEKKRELGYTYEQIALLSDVPLGTVQKVFSGVTKAPRYETLRALERLFRAKKQEVEEALSDQNTSFFAEKHSSEKEARKGTYSLVEYYAIAGGKRIELIDGMLYEMEPLSSLHQLIVGEIYGSIHRYICEKECRGVSVFAPIEVMLDRSGKTVVQPDVLVVLSQEQIRQNSIYGGPALVVEVLSEPSKRKDFYLKLAKYEEAGVQEYWIVDPESKQVMVYNFQSESFPTVYRFEDKIPVFIFRKECEIDFSEIYERVRFLYEGEVQH